jgi:hypothetical protein
MASKTERPTEILAEIESYLEQIGKTISPVGDTKFQDYLISILRDESPKQETLRRAFEFPSQVNLRQDLTSLLESQELSLMPLKNVCAQRLYHLLWRFKFTVEEIDAEWREEVLQKTRSLLLLVDPYLTARRPNLLHVKAALEFAGDPVYFSESVADPMLFAALRAFEYDELREPLPIPDEQRLRFKKETLDFIFVYLSEVLSRQREIDDSSNAWWAVRVGVESGEERFQPLIRIILDRFPSVVAPRDEIRKKSTVPEIYTRLRTSAYTLSNIQAILEQNFALEAELKKQLDAMIQELLTILQDTPRSNNLYLASVHYESLRNYLDYEEFKLIADIVTSGRLQLSEFSPVGEFVCADSTLSETLSELKTWLLSDDVRGHRQSVLIYGPSSVGKSFLIEQLFKEGKQKHLFKDRQVICTPDVDVIGRIASIASEISSSPTVGVPPFIFLDEADTERKSSFFPNLIDFLDKGSIRDGAPQLREFVLFWGGGKYGSVDNLRNVLEHQQENGPLQKGFDVFNRAKFKINLPAALLRNKNLKLLLGLAGILRFFNKSQLTIDTSVFTWLRNMPLAFGTGVRQFGNIVRKLKLEDGIVRVPGVSQAGITVEVVN